MEQTYTRQFLKEVLALNKLPNSTPALNKYEREGIIPAPSRVAFKSRSWRVYTHEDIQNIVKSLTAYVKKNNVA